MLRLMGHFSVVGFVACALCVAACLYESGATANTGGDVTAVTIEKATEAVNEAKNSTNEVSGKAESEISKIKLLLQNLERFKKDAEEAEANAVNEPLDNEQTKAIVGTIKSSSTHVKTLYLSVNEKLANAITSLENVVAESKKLNAECNTVLPSTEDASTNYSEAKAKALGIKSKAEALNTNITAALGSINEVSSTANEMKKSAKKAQMANLHVSGIVAVTKIETTIREADGIINNIQKQKRAVDDIVTEMQNIKANTHSDSIGSINTLFESAREALRNVTSAVDNATKARQAMEQQKEPAGTALANIEKANKEDTAQLAIETVQREVTAAHGCVDKVNEIFSQLQNALQAAEISVANANAFKQKMKDAMSTATSETSTNPIKKTAKSDPSMEGGTRSDEKEATAQPTSKELPDQSNGSTEKEKDTLIKGAQNMPTTALTGGKAPAPGAKNDSAMTVSVPLLVALIASAVLQ